jgi:hypothetical protein
MLLFGREGVNLEGLVTTADEAAAVLGQQHERRKPAGGATASGRQVGRDRRDGRDSFSSMPVYETPRFGRARPRR